MVNNSIKLDMSYKNDSFLNQFPAIIGILSVLSYPIFSSIWKMEPIGISEYVELLVVFSLLFLFLLILSGRVALIRGLFSLYVTLVMPVFCVLASFAIVEVLSASEYGMALIILHVAYALIWFFTRSYILNLSLFNQINRAVLSLLPLGYGLIFWAWVFGTYDLLQPKFWSAWVMVPAIVFLVLFCLWAVDLWQRRSRPGYQWVIYLLMVLILTGLVYRPELFVDRWHYNYFMAPLNDVIHGKVLFVNTTSQYGVGVIYALALAFWGLHLPIGYEGLSFVIAILFILQYLLLAYMLWKISGDLILGVAGVLVMVYFNYLTVFWPSMLRTPAQSPLRYGLPYLLLGMAFINTKYSKRYFRVLELVFLSIASVWSLETFLYAVLSLNAFYFVNDLLFAPQFQVGLKAFGKRLMVQAGIIAISWSLLFIFTHVISRQPLNTRMYFDYFQSYTTIPYDGGSIAPHIFRTGVVMFVYLFSIFAVLFDRLRQKNFLSTAMSSMLVGMSAAGILQYVYYFIFYIDYHLALLCVPLIFVLALWVAAIRRSSSMSSLFRANVITVLFFSLIVCMISTVPSFYDKFSKSLLYESMQKQGVVLTSPYYNSPSNKTVENLVHLIQNYAGSEQQIALFAAPEDQVEALFLTGKTDLLGMSDPGMSAISLVYSEYILREAKTMAGQPIYIFYDTAKEALMPLQQEAYRALVGAASYKVIDKRKNIVVLKKVN
ncbi:MAG: hypothetical protein HY863_16695 [Chloroflexi bacterium]|nr:hypothetical protein [Chloroflexota bacterium]